MPNGAADNGKIVQLVQQLVEGDRLRCIGCGQVDILTRLNYITWEVEAVSAPLEYIGAMCSPRQAVFSQPDLIPLGDDHTEELEKEAVDETTKVIESLPTAAPVAPTTP